ICAPPITKSGPTDKQVTVDKNLIPGEFAINTENQSQNRGTSQEVRGEIHIRVYSTWKGASNKPLSTIKDVQVAGDMNFGGSNINRTETEDGENEVDFDIVYTYNTITQTTQDTNSTGNYMHQNSKVQQVERTGRGTTRDAGYVQKGTPTTQRRDVIEVENSEQFSFGVKATGNIITKENLSHAGK
ncbi:hypothetical protein EJD97_012888, partial [Solanum chilense]